ncbi:MAG: ATP-binding protein [Chloroflexi bacterium]|nr:ATP-binding protein [Chloroflexota bacterium]
MYAADNSRREMQTGRGGSTIYPFPVSLEPAFARFTHHAQAAPAAVPAGAAPDRTRLTLGATVRVRPSREERAVPESAEQLLLSLSGRLSFEVIGHDGIISFQFAVNRQASASLVASVNTLYPNAEAFAAQDLLRPLASSNVVARSYRLRESHFFPLKTDSKLDYFGLLFAALTGMRAEEFGVLQVVFERARHDWNYNILMGSRNPFDQKPLFFDLPDLYKLAESKAAKALYAVSLRLAASSTDIVNRMEGFVRQFEGNNGFIAVAGQYPGDSIFQRSVHSTGILLNVQELSAALVHLPAPSVLSLSVQCAGHGTAPPASATHTVLVPLGTNEHGGIRRRVGISEDDLARHLLVIGQSGAGKTTLTLHIMSSLVQQGYGLDFIDPSGDGAREFLGLIPVSRMADTAFFDLSDRDFPVAFNVLEGAESRDRELLCSDLMASFENYFRASWGVRMAMLMRNTVNLLFSTPEEKTLLDMRRVLTDTEYRDGLLSRTADPPVIDFWQTIYPTLPKAAMHAVTDKLSEFLDTPTTRNIVAQPSLIDVSEMMNSSKILVASLPKAYASEDAVNLLGSFLLAKLRIATLARASLPQTRRRLCPIVLEEAHNFCNTRANASILVTFLSEARRHRVPLILVTQFLSQLHPDAVQGILANVQTIVVFRCGLPDAQLLERELGRFKVDDLLNLKTGEALVRIGTASASFRIKVDAPRQSNRAVAEEIVRSSRARYCRPRQEVERMILAGWRGGPTAAQKPVARGTDEPSGDELRFLEYVSRNPSLPTTASYRALGLSNYSGNKIKQELVRKGLLSEVKTKLGRRARIAKFLIPSQAACAKLGLPAYHGRGGPVHQYLQSLVSQQAATGGYQVQVEQKIPGSDESVDVLIQKDSVMTAIEIAVSSTAERELQNIKKCLAAGYGRMVVLFVDPGTLDDTMNLARKSLSEKDIDKVKLGLVNESSRFL